MAAAGAGGGAARVALGFALPSTEYLRGVWHIDSIWDSQAYTAADPGGVAGLPFDETRTHGALTVSDWLSPHLRYSVTGGIDSWRGRSYTGRTVLAGGSLERRWVDDRFSLSATVTAWAPASFHTSGARAAYQSSREADGWSTWLIRASIGQAARRRSRCGPAPMTAIRARWMRAHPLLNSGAIDSGHAIRVRQNRPLHSRRGAAMDRIRGAGPICGRGISRTVAQARRRLPAPGSVRGRRRRRAARGFQERGVLRLDTRTASGTAPTP